MGAARQQLAACDPIPQQSQQHAVVPPPYRSPKLASLAAWLHAVPQSHSLRAGKYMDRADNERTQAGGRASRPSLRSYTVLLRWRSPLPARPTLLACLSRRSVRYSRPMPSSGAVGGSKGLQAGSQAGQAGQGRTGQQAREPAAGQAAEAWGQLGMAAWRHGAVPQTGRASSIIVHSRAHTCACVRSTELRSRAAPSGAPARPRRKDAQPGTLIGRAGAGAGAGAGANWS